MYTDALGRTVRTVYDDGSLTETLYRVTTDPEGDTIPTPTSWISIPSGGSETVNLAQRKLGDPIVATYNVYDADGRLIDVYQPAVMDGDGSPTALVNPHWHYGYDTAGNEITQTSPTGHSLTGAVSAGGNVTTFGFDQNGNQVRQTLPDNEVETWTYNVYNQVSSFTDFDGNVATYTYATNYNTAGTDAGDLLSVVYAGAPGSGKATQTVTYTYDSLNRQHTVTDASGTTTSTYDAAGDLIESNTPEGDIHYVFNLARGDHTETYTAYTDTAYGYDSQDRLTSVTVKELNGTTLATPLVTTYTYDAAGNKKTEVLPDGEVSTYGYDDLNRLTSLVEVQGSTTLFSETIIVNDDGTRKSASEVQLQPDGTTVDTNTTWTYDADGRLTSETVDAAGAAPATPQGLALTLTLPSNYNLENETTDTLTWDGSNAYVSNGKTESNAGVGYPNPGEVLFDPAAGVAWGGNGSDWVLVADDDQDPGNDAESFTLSNGMFTPDNVVAYNHDFNGTPSFNVATPAGFDYADYYSYDLDNNRTQSIHVGPVGGANETITYVYNGDDELKSQSSSLNGTTTNTYDANGSLKSSTTGGVTTTYTYDSRNKMVGYASGGTSAKYVYDDDGDRVAEMVTTGGTSTTTLYLTDTQNPTGYDQPIEQRTSTSAAPSLTFTLGDRVLGQADGRGAVFYLLIDGHGSTQQLTSSTGVVTSSMRYTAFGNALNFTVNDAGTVFLFGGDAVYDQLSGLYLHGNGIRSGSGFELFQRDTYAGRSQNPVTFHKYLYADANTISFQDPSGRVVPFTLEDTLEAVDLSAEVDTWENEGGALAQAADVAADVTAQNIMTGQVADAALSSSEVADMTIQVAGNIGSIIGNVSSAGLNFVSQVTNLGVAVIGRFPLYLLTATSVGASFFNIPPGEWATLTEEARQAANVEAITAMAEAGQTFVLVGVGYGQATLMEINLPITQYGYVWNAAHNALIPGR